MVSYRFVPISSQKGVLFFETPGNCFYPLWLYYLDNFLTDHDQLQ